jgi:hypothetical protein
MKAICHAIDVALTSQSAVFTKEETEALNQLADKAAQVQMGDGNFLEVEVCYAVNPRRR